MEANHIYNENCMQTVARMPDDYLNCVVTSPPYFGLRDYGNDEQFGLEETPEAFVANLVNLFREIKRVLRDDGTVWLNLGDSYAGYWGDKKAREEERKSSADTNGWTNGFNMNARPSFHNAFNGSGIKPKDLIGIPWRVAFALQADGWYLRQDLIWHKPNPMPESVTDRCTKAHEYVFLLSKSAKYHYDHEAIKERSQKGSAGSLFHTGKTGKHQLGRASSKPRNSGNIERKQRPNADVLNIGAQAGSIPWEFTETRNKRSVWTVSTKPYKGAHFATFPEKLIEPCILAGCPKGGILYDPFIGSGTTALVAHRAGRQWIGSELNPEYVAIATKRIEPIIMQPSFL